MKRFTTFIFAAAQIALLAFFLFGVSPSYAANATEVSPATCTNWQYVASPNVTLSHDDYLNAVSATAANDIWSAGYYISNNRIGHHLFANLSLIEHWDGTQWSVIPTPNPGSQTNYLNGVTFVPGTQSI